MASNKLNVTIVKDKLTNIPEQKFPNDLPNTFVRTVHTVAQQEDWNNKFMDKYKKFRDEENKIVQNSPTFMWNNNNTLESMKLVPNLIGNSDVHRMTCHSAPEWWYPKDEYNPEQFRAVYHGDYFNPVYNFLGNAQEMFWDFRSVRDF